MTSLFLKLISRRTFMRFIACVSVVFSTLKVNAVAASQTRQSASVLQGYGTGRYGMGAYPGYKLYLPTIKQGE